MNSKLYIIKKIFFLMLLFLVISCQNNDYIKTQDQINQEFTTHSVQVLEELSSYYPSSDLGIKITKDKDGNFYSVYKLKGLNEELMHLRNPNRYRKPQLQTRSGGGTSCQGGNSCAVVLYECLSGGGTGTMTGGGCEGGSGYCVICTPAHR